jgi:hypothetical protein
MTQIQSILIKPEFKEMFFKKENGKVSKISKAKYWILYDNSWTNKKIEVLGPITKEQPTKQ